MSSALTAMPMANEIHVPGSTVAAGETKTPEQIFERIRAREVQLSHLLVFFICGGLLFMVLPGTFLGVWNLISISSRRAQAWPASLFDSVLGASSRQSIGNIRR